MNLFFLSILSSAQSLADQLFIDQPESDGEERLQNIESGDVS